MTSAGKLTTRLPWSTITGKRIPMFVDGRVTTATKNSRAFKTHLAKFHPQMKEDLEKRSSLRLHQCQICSKVYGHKSDLQRHINIHEGVKPFKCTHCMKAFNDKESMRCHMKRIHCADTRMKCNYCCKKFVHQKTLKLHEYKVHGIGLVKDNLS